MTKDLATNNLALYQRVNDLADSIGITAEEAFKQAFSEWLESRSPVVASNVLQFPVRE